MKPMFLQMQCVFCKKSLEELKSHSGSGLFSVYLCRDCIYPEHHTLYKQLYFNNGFQLLVDAIQIDEYYICRYFKKTTISGKENYTSLSKNVIGSLDNSNDMEPISLNHPICEIDHIMDLQFDNIKLLKQKLAIYTTFS